ncbi:hypothetical protein [Roseimicrobium sp. ORNL1]|uniref:hypothetical protein n=1 Tax=Roseimicrobium sp. ORNL1 TaxID=2711231 RepID=UPI0013E1EDC8|nr:hypothetical protein [Roseimicrobium sp. ORNL1]QIF01442.1 hypothetical protein G5S37_07875 [Roseimicrobium sp. ORNL1]
MKKHSWNAALTHSLYAGRTLALLTAFLLSCLESTIAETPDYVHATGDTCLLHENNAWFIAKFEGFVQVTDMVIWYEADDKERKPKSKPHPTLQVGDEKVFRENTLMVLLDVLQHPLSSEQDARAWKDKSGWEKGEWQKNLLREVKDVKRIDIAADKKAPPQKK